MSCDRTARLAPLSLLTETVYRLEGCGGTAAIAVPSGAITILPFTSESSMRGNNFSASTAKTTKSKLTETGTPNSHMTIVFIITQFSVAR
jgi:hypothetical protein